VKTLKVALKKVTNPVFQFATILSKSGEKKQQSFSRAEDGVLNPKNWGMSEQCEVVACESTSDFLVPFLIH
jgi:transposase